MQQRRGWAYAPGFVLVALVAVACLVVLSALGVARAGFPRPHARRRRLIARRFGKRPL